jgi:hypothetical protein
MEPLESKLDRLSPEQRKETEVFVDFLLSRSGQAYMPMEVSRNSPPVLRGAPPPLTMIEPVQVIDAQPVGLEDHGRMDDRIPPAAGNDAVSAPFQEIGGDIQDRISHDYMDYGQFERQSSPATEAVKKVKGKLIAKEGQDKPRHLLDWVD